MFNGFFDIEFRLEKIDQNGDPLVPLNEIVNWELFRPLLDSVRPPKKKSDSGPKGFDNILMFKTLILQSLYNLSDAATEAQILDRLTFHRFLGLSIGDKVPDEKTIWLFREQLKNAELTKELFDLFDLYLRENGFEARGGQIVDASIVQCPKQRNTRKENELIKEGKAEKIEDWSEAKTRQKDTDARWKSKNNKNYFGYENHIQTDVKHKFIRDYQVTDASVHDSQVFGELIDPNNTSKDVYADSAYGATEARQMLEKQGYNGKIQFKGARNHPLAQNKLNGNKTRAKVRARVEHIFGIMSKRMKSTILYGIGLLRANNRIGLRNLSFNITRYVYLAK